MSLSYTAIPVSQTSLDQVTTANSEENNTQSVLERLLEKVEVVNFRKLAGENFENDPDKKLLQKHRLISTVEYVLSVAKENNYDIRRRNGAIYTYNGELWKIIQEDELEVFLGKAAEAMGEDKFNARHYEYRQRLLKQFLTAGLFPTVSRSNQSVLINLANGTFHVSKSAQELRNFNKDDFLTYQLSFPYDPQAKSPLFLAYLNTVLPDKDLQNVLAEYIGYVFIRHLKLEKVLLLYGSGANGKSVFFEVINALLGSQNISNYSLQSLTNEAYRAKLADKLLNYGSEIKGSLESDIFKQLASGEPVEAKPLYRDPFTMRDYAKLMFNCNVLPKDVEHTEAYFRRFLIVPFEVTIREDQRDPELPAKIVGKELSGVFNWVVEGLTRLLHKKQFTRSTKSDDILKQYQTESDTVALFLSEEGYSPTAKDTIRFTDLYQKYREFCISSGYNVLNSRNFSDRLSRNKIRSEKGNMGRMVLVAKAPLSF